MTASLHITRFRKSNDGLLSKRITLGNDGKPVSDDLLCQMWEGTATRIEIIPEACIVRGELLPNGDPENCRRLCNRVEHGDAAFQTLEELIEYWRAGE